MSETVNGLPGKGHNMREDFPEIVHLLCKRRVAASIYWPQDIESCSECWEQLNNQSKTEHALMSWFQILVTCQLYGERIGKDEGAEKVL